MDSELLKKNVLIQKWQEHLRNIKHIPTEDVPALYKQLSESGELVDSGNLQFCGGYYHEVYNLEGDKYDFWFESECPVDCVVIVGAFSK